MLAETSGKAVQPSRRDDLLRAMAQEEARLQRLEAEQATARARLAAVRAELATLDKLEAYPDDRQWAYLASVRRIDPGTVELIAREATRLGSVVGVQLADTADEDDAAPWARLPSRKPKPAVITGPLPPKVRAVLAQNGWRSF
jgi:hypothetical protein